MVGCSKDRCGSFRSYRFGSYPYMYCINVDAEMMYKDLGVIVSMMVMCHDIEIKKHDERRSGLAS